MSVIGTAELAVLAQLALGIFFLLSGAAKLLRPNEFIDGVRQYGLLPDVLVAPSGIGLILLELAIGLLHTVGTFVWLAAPITLCLVSGMLVAAIVVIRQGIQIRCLCFGSRGTDLVSERTVVRLGLVAGGTVFIWTTVDSAATARFQMTLSESMMAAMCAVLVLILLYWAENAPELIRIWRECQHCGRTRNE